jgi:hypothetical protein
MKKIILAASLLFSSSAMADDTAITIYSKAGPGAVSPELYMPSTSGNYGYSSIPGYAIVRHIRDVKLPYKSNILKFTDVAAYLDPTTVQFKSITDPKGTKVAEQNFQFDLVSQQKLMQKYIDKEIEVEQVVGDKVELLKGTLLSVQDGLTLKTDKGIVTIPGYPKINFPDLPEGLITKPTLVWNILTDKEGTHKTEVSYQTEGVTWWADYNLTFTEGKNANSGTIDLGSWVSILNKSGATYKDAKLKLMAGDVQRVTPQAAPMMMKERAVYDMAGAAPAPEFAEKSFFEYHLYTLNTPATIPDNSTKQLELVKKAVNVPVEKLLIYNGTEGYNYYPGSNNIDRYFGQSSPKKVAVFLKFQNKEANGLGIPMPAGRIRVNQRDADGSLEFVGEDVIDHTPRNEEVKIKLGEAFDVVGERKQTNFFIDEARHIIEEEFAITVRNQKKQDAKVRVVENLYRAANWQLTEKSDAFEKDDSNTIHFDLNIGSEKSKTVTYKVRYTW